MTRNDYKLIAKLILKVSHPSVGIPSQVIKVLIWEFASILEKDNPRFDRGMFVKACLGE